MLERLQWLTRRGCEFSFDVGTEIATRRSAAPKWKPEYAEHAAESREMRGGHIATDTECGPLIREPITSVLSKALELSGRSETNSLSTVREITDALSAPSPCPVPRGARGHWTVIFRTVLTPYSRSLVSRSSAVCSGIVAVGPGGCPGVHGAVARRSGNCLRTSARIHRLRRPGCESPTGPRTSGRG